MSATQPSSAALSTQAQPAGLAVANQGTSSRRPRRRSRPTSLVGKIVLGVALAAFALLFLYPFVWLLAASFKPRGQVFDNKLVPETFLPGNYADVWHEMPLLSWMGNSVLIAVLAAGFVALSSSVVAFGFAYFKFPGRTFLFGLVLATMMLPGS
jgi:multiple sugar transport system permease protein